MKVFSFTETLDFKQPKKSYLLDMASGADRAASTGPLLSRRVISGKSIGLQLSKNSKESHLFRFFIGRTGHGASRLLQAALAQQQRRALVQQQWPERRHILLQGL